GVAAQLVPLAALAFTAPAAIASPVAGMPPVALEGMVMPDTTAASVTVTVHAGDCLWSIAQRYLGAGDRYPEIAALNDGRPMGDGAVFTDPSLILPGWRLLLPAGAAVGEPALAGAPVSAGAHSGPATTDPQDRQRHRTAKGREGNVVSATGGADSGTAVAPGPAGSSEAAVSRPLAEQAARLPAGSQVPESAVFVTGALAGAILTSLMRLRFR